MAQLVGRMGSAHGHRDLVDRAVKVLRLEVAVHFGDSWGRVPQGRVRRPNAIAESDRDDKRYVVAEGRR